MQTQIGTLTLAYLAETGGTSLSYADAEAQALIAERAGWTARSEQRIRRELLRMLDRDERFSKEFVHATINGQARKVRVYHIAGTARAVPPVSPVVLPSDPWRRRQFLGALLEIDARSVSEAHATERWRCCPLHWRGCRTNSASASPRCLASAGRSRSATPSEPKPSSAAR